MHTKPHEERVELLVVERTLCLRSDRRDTPCILVIHPDLSVPNEGWKERTEAVAVLRPDGHEFEATAVISLSHVNIRGPDVSIDRIWRVAILFPNKTSEDVPAGSRILVSNEIRGALLPKTAA
jgi:hypothetical protein